MGKDNDRKDVELKDISMDTWRNALGTITQDTYIFHASFSDNIRLARPEATADEVEKTETVAEEGKTPEATEDKAKDSSEESTEEDKA